MRWLTSNTQFLLSGLMIFAVTTAYAGDAVTSFYDREPTADEMIRNLTGGGTPADADLPEGLLPDATDVTPAVSYRGIRIINATSAKPNETTEVSSVAADPSPPPAEPARNGCSIRGKPIALKVEFASGSARVDGGSVPVLHELAKAMNSPALENCIFSVEGHTDSVGDASYNLRLSWDRALSVKHQLIGESVDPLRMAVVGRGEQEPLVTENPRDARNRRVQVRIVGQK
ncbi:MAG: OmpA family protein [Chromatiales bacterium]|nr:OmpA family protein [Chromatiales bacterium]